jgi:hypothetical protein
MATEGAHEHLPSTARIHRRTWRRGGMAGRGAAPLVGRIVAELHLSKPALRDPARILDLELARDAQGLAPLPPIAVWRRLKDPVAPVILVRVHRQRMHRCCYDRFHFANDRRVTGNHAQAVVFRLDPGLLDGKPQPIADVLQRTCCMLAEILKGVSTCIAVVASSSATASSSGGRGSSLGG